jgi:polysaccharide biosynthesis/export protein
MNRLFFAVVVSVFIIASACSRWVTPYRMYKVDKETPLSSVEELMVFKEHVFAADDELMIYVYANDGQEMINPNPDNSVNSGTQDISYRVLKDGTVFLPAIGAFDIAGKTITEAESELRIRYQFFVNNPFVLLKVLNKQVYVYKGGKAGGASTVLLNNPNATVIEALTSAGGIADGKSDKIFLIRGTGEDVKFYKIDLSDAQNASLGNIVVQSDDVIYIEPQPFVSRRLLEDITPILSLSTTFLLIYNLFK